MAQREQWGSRIGLILAMAGNAVGLGNFLRFPVQAAQNGGGAFMIPYFFAFLFLAIPLMWVEWAIGRRGGRYGSGSTPGMLDVLWRNPLAKYLGIFGMFVSLVIFVYYTYLVSWTLGYSFFSMFRTYFGTSEFDRMSLFLTDYLGGKDFTIAKIGFSYFFLLLTVGLNFYILKRGIRGGIEKLAKIGMPLLFIFGILIVIWVFTLGAPDPINHPERTIWAGLAFIWNPDFSQLSSSKIWLAASGQVFFTLSIGMGCIQSYASYLDKKQDIVLSGLATSSLNEFAEVIIGGSIAIPVAVAFFGIQNTQSIAQGGTFELGFISMPMIFQQVPYIGSILGFMWFFLLFIAGLTSTVAMAQPLVSFLKEEFKYSHIKSIKIIGITSFVLIHFVLIFQSRGFLGEMDFWAGTFFLTLFALVEIVVFAWGFGMDNAWKEIHYGADIRIPKFFKFIIKYLTPVYISTLLIYWTLTDAVPYLMMEGANPQDIPIRWMARIIMILIFVVLAILINKAWKRNKRNYDEIFKEEKI